jgi:AcrR family transcriptional regulator
MDKSAKIYSVTQSAIIDDGGGLRERKRAATRMAIRDTARELTAEHGLNHFTIEQLCERVGISRRTFFNYFPTKEDAIIGHQDDGIPDDLVEEFVQGGKDSPAGVLSPGLVDDMAELACRAMERLSLTKEQYRQLIDVVHKEPQLLARIMGHSALQEQAFALLVARREGLDPADPRARIATLFMATMSRKAGDEFFSPDNTRSYRDILGGYIATARELFQH